MLLEDFLEEVEWRSLQSAKGDFQEEEDCRGAGLGGVAYGLIAGRGASWLEWQAGKGLTLCPRPQDGSLHGGGSGPEGRGGSGWASAGQTTLLRRPGLPAPASVRRVRCHEEQLGHLAPGEAAAGSKDAKGRALGTGRGPARPVC